MERDRFEPILPRESGDETVNINIAGETFNLMDRLRHRAPITYSLDKIRDDKMEPGDSEAQDLLRVFTNIGVTPAEYRTAMPQLFELVAKKEGGFDADLIDVTRFLMKRTLLLRGGEGKVFRSPYPDRTRLAYFADVYGQLRIISGLMWDERGLEQHKKKLIALARDYNKKIPWPR